MSKGHVYRNQTFVGELRKEAMGFVFQYDENYLVSPNAKNISVHFPLQKEPFFSKHLFAFFYNMLSEGNLKKMQCRNMKIDESDSFTRLLKTASDDTIGSITVKEVKDA